MASERLLERDDFYAVASEVLSRGDGLRFEAGGNSMLPFIRTGDALVVQPFQEGQLFHPGDVLLCRLASGQLVAHRLRIIRPGRLSLQGDACPYPDGWMTPGDVLGRVVSVERHGKSLFPNNLLAKLWLLLAPLRPLIFRIYCLLRR